MTSKAMQQEGKTKGIPHGSFGFGQPTEDNNNNGGMNPEPEITIQGVIKDEEETKETGFKANY